MAALMGKGNSQMHFIDEEEDERPRIEMDMSAELMLAQCKADAGSNGTCKAASDLQAMIDA